MTKSARYVLLTVREKLEFLAPDTGAKKGGYMNSNNNNNKIIKGTFGKMRQVKDFLPSPQELVLKEAQAVKVTMSLDRGSIEFFKQEAKRLGSSYQRMIRNLLNEYAIRHHRDGRRMNA